MNPILYTLNTILIVFPALWLFAFCFKNRVKISWVRTNICAVIVFIITLAVSMIFKLGTSPLKNWEIPVSFALILLYLLVCIFLVKSTPSQIVFVLFILTNYVDIVTLYVRVLSVMLTDASSEGTYHIFSIINFIVNMVAFPLMVLFISNILRPMINQHVYLPYWKYLWILPACNFIICRFVINPNYTTQIYQFNYKDFLLPTVWGIATFLSYFVMLRMLLAVKANAKLEENLRISQLRISAQENQYKLIEASIEETRRHRHDLRHHMLAIKGYIKNKNYDSLDSYLDGLLSNTNSYIPVCNNQAIDSILQHYSHMANDNNISLKTSITIPEVLPIPESDFCIIMCNLMENSIEACLRQTALPRFIDIKVEVNGPYMLIFSVKNSFEGDITVSNDTFMSSKRPSEGIGVASVRSMAEKHNGAARFDHANNVFSAYVLVTSNQKKVI